MEFFTVFFCLLVAHWACDYPLQGDFLSRAKADGPLPNYHLAAHSGIQAGGVFIVTGSILLAVLEWVAHFAIDLAKTRGHTNFAIDQALHIACKVLWAVILLGL